MTEENNEILNALNKIRSKDFAELEKQIEAMTGRAIFAMTTSADVSDVYFSKCVIELCGVLKKEDQKPFATKSFHLDELFVRNMSRQIEANQHKGDFSLWEPEKLDLVRHLARKFSQLIQALQNPGERRQDKITQAVTMEATDLANFAMKASAAFGITGEGARKPDFKLSQTAEEMLILAERNGAYFNYKGDNVSLFKDLIENEIMTRTDNPEDTFECYRLTQKGQEFLALNVDLNKPRP